ncbi:PRC-barrel domain-containing protein [Psychromarinibacter sp. S121]|uniref:PRC-barrel domain-containing protein n=1 Tax=Psychromarinibacter sp. S121 TaxID=3415127 RepID=UPI003C7EA5E8
MRKLLMTTAVAVAMATPGMAATQTEGFMTQSEAGDFYGSELIGKRLYVSEAEVDAEADWTEEQRAEWDDVGEINDIIIGDDGEVKAVLLDIGGFLGIGEKTVAVDMSQLKFVTETADAEDYFIVIQGSEAMLESAPQFDMAAVSPEGAIDETMATEETAEADMADAEMTPEDEMAEAEATMENAADEAGEEMAEAGNEIENAAEEAGDELAEAGNAVENAAENAADEAGEELAEAGNAVENAAENAEAEVSEEMAEADAEMTDEAMPAEEEMAETDGTAGGWATPEVERDGYETVQMVDLTAEMLQGTYVYGADEENVGEIADLVMTEDGQVEAALIDVGGFLGIGEHRIEVDFEELQVLREQEGNGVEVHISATKDQLKERPAYDG